MFRRVMAEAGMGAVSASPGRSHVPLLPRPPFGGQYDDVVSLGRACQPAHQIRRLLGIRSAQIFDWLITTDRGLVTLVETGLDGFFALDRLGPGTSGVVVDMPTDTRFLHEFPGGSELGAQHAQHAERIALLVARWRELLGSRRRVLFVRVHMGKADPHSSAVRLREAIRKRAPKLRFTILYLTEHTAETISWGAEDIINGHLTQPEPYDWRGDDAVWESLLTEALAARARWWRWWWGLTRLRQRIGKAVRTTLANVLSGSTRYQAAAPPFGG